MNASLFLLILNFIQSFSSEHKNCVPSWSNDDAFYKDIFTQNLSFAVVLLVKNVHVQTGKYDSLRTDYSFCFMQDSLVVNKAVEWQNAEEGGLVLSLSRTKKMVLIIVGE